MVTRRLVKTKVSNKTESSQAFTSEQTTLAIKKSSKAVGPDGISNLHLNDLGPSATDYLTALFNLSLKTSQIPQIWKSSIIIPLLKPGKEANNLRRPATSKDSGHPVDI